MLIRPFISYAHEDRALAQRLYSDLQAAGAQPWLDTEDLLGGQDWEISIARAIRESSHFLALISTNSVNKRGFVQKELRDALELLQTFPPDEVFVIPIRIDDSIPRHDRLSKLHRVDLFPNYESGFGRLARSLGLEPLVRDVHGLGDIRNSKNSIGIDTFFRSGGVPESVLRESGAPEEFIQYAASLVGRAIENYSCFLSYSSKDDDFARRLYNDLQGKNIRTWFAPEDLKIGDHFRSRIDDTIRFHDKLVLILSTNSVTSDWVQTEVKSALERERKEGKDVLFPIAIDEEGFTSKQPWVADIRRKRHISDFRKWKSHDDYTAAFDRLVRDLKKSQPPIIMKG